MRLRGLYLAFIGRASRLVRHESRSRVLGGVTEPVGMERLGQLNVSK